jgi:hypothetical protein
MDINQKKPGFAQTTFIYSAIVAIAAFILANFASYMIYSGEPQGEIFSVAQAFPFVICLLSAVAGVLSVKSYVGEVGQIKIGTGAQIGLLSGVSLAVVMTVLGIFLTVIYPDLNIMVAEYNIENYEILAQKGVIPEASLNDVRDEFMKQIENPLSLSTLGLSFVMQTVMYSIVNLISGLVTAKITAKD